MGILKLELNLPDVSEAPQGPVASCGIPCNYKEPVPEPHGKRLLLMPAGVPRGEQNTEVVLEETHQALPKVYFVFKVTN